MANNTLNLNQIVSIFEDLALRQQQVNDFGYGPSYNIGASRQMKFPYIWIENNQSISPRSQNGYKEHFYTFTMYCVDKINFGEDNYEEIISNCHFILDSMIQEIAQHKYYIDYNLSIANDIIFTPVVEATDDNVNGWQCEITIKHPIRLTPCNTPITPIAGYTTQLNTLFTEYRLIGATGPQGPTGPAGPTGPGGSLAAHGSFYSTQSQIIATSGIPQVVTFNGVYTSNFINVVGGDKITFDYAGTYQLTFTAQLLNLDNDQHDVDFWIKYNGNDFPNSTTEILTNTRKSAGIPSEQIVTINLTGVAQNANDYIQLYWRATGVGAAGNVSLGFATHSGIPDAPSIKASITPVMFAEKGATGSTGATGPAGASGLAFDYTRTNPTGGGSWHTFQRRWSFGAQSVQGPTKAYAIMVERQVTIDAVFGRGNTNTATTMLVGIYTNVENQARPDTLIAAGTASFNWTSTGLQTITIPPVTLNPGIYWVGFSFANGNTGALIQGMITTGGGLFMPGINPGNGNPMLIWVEPGIYTQSMPATWNGASSSYIPSTGGNVPYLAWRIQGS